MADKPTREDAKNFAFSSKVKDDVNSGRYKPPHNYGGFEILIAADKELEENAAYGRTHRALKWRS